ncbi:NUMOD4 motif-containing HNH endonuclease [Ideonella sp. YS5]|uniref:NUMOD4 motif-containing HNH endonuclease n=1 Tax=Ideonella sp. YS5 TaxID=3453714 RepID=UPI003EEFD65D
MYKLEPSQTAASLPSPPPDRNHIALSANLRCSSLFGIEAWRPIPGLPGYQVSSFGKVRSLPRVIQRGGRSARMSGRILRPTLLKVGYLALNIRGATRYVHHLVCDAFHGPCPSGMERRHLNGSKTCNWASNLAYGTSLENHDDMRRHGRAPLGERNHSATLTMAEVAWARQQASGGHSDIRIAAMLDRPVKTINAAVIGRTWAHCPVPPVRRRPGCTDRSGGTKG